MSEVDKSVREDFRFWDLGEEAYGEWKAKSLEDRMSYFGYPSPHYMIPVGVGEWRALVDEDIAEVVYRLWKAGVPTSAACQGGERCVPFPEDLTEEELEEWGEDDEKDTDTYLGFPTTEAVCAFVNLVSPEDKTVGGIYDRMTGGYGRYHEEDGEEVSAYPDEFVWNWSVSCPHRVGDEKELSMMILARFPHADIPELLRRIKTA